MKKRLKCLYEQVGRESYTTADDGLRVVETARIVGTVDKCGELDAEFRPLHRRDRGERQRRARLAAAMGSPAAHALIPPVDLYGYRGGYYVLDGHRRVAAARAAGVAFIDAHVTAFVPQGDPAAVRGAVSRRRFEQETGLKNLRLNYESGYADLLEQIGDGPDPQARARDWYSGAFLPGCRRIERSGLQELFPALLQGDIYVLVLRFHRDFDSGFPRAAGFESVLAAFIETYRKRRRRLWPFRRRPWRRFGGS